MSGSWTFGQRLFLGFAAVVGLGVLSAISAVQANRSVSEAKDRVLTVALQDLGDAALLQLLSEQRISDARGYLLTAEPEFQRRLAGTRRECQALLDQLRARTSERGSAQLERVATALEAHATALERAVAARARPEADVPAVAHAFNADVVPRGDELRAAIDAFVARRRELVEEERALASDEATRSQALVAGAAALSVILGAVIALVLGRALARQLGAAVQHMQSSSAELQAASSQQASATREQGTAMSEIGTTIRELLATSRQIAEGAQRVARIADETAAGARAGGEVVERAQEAIGETKRHMELVVEKMLDLGRRSQQIGGVLELVAELLSQTNILAINATIEAAGAGEGGKRFAAVADEIRKLSDRVAGSAKEVRALTDEVRASVHATIMATEGGAKAVDVGTRRFGEVSVTFQRITAQVSTTREAAREIELSTKQQTTAVEQVNAAIVNVSQSARETEASTAQTVQTASELAALSRELSRLVRADA